MATTRKALCLQTPRLQPINVVGRISALSLSKQQRMRAASTSHAVKGKKPKILDENPPKPGEEPEDVKKHNEDMDHRAERAATRVKPEDADKDKVSPKFWSNEGGARDKES